MEYFNFKKIKIISYHKIQSEIQFYQNLKKNDTIIGKIEIKYQKKNVFYIFK